jgi:hypothetical protein
MKLQLLILFLTVQLICEASSNVLASSDSEKNDIEEKVNKFKFCRKFAFEIK